MTTQDVEARVARALDYHHAGYNCAQCVACACADVVEMDEEQAFRLAEGFGAGMGGFTETCGAISGGVLLFGQVSSGGPAAEPRTKAATYELSKQLAQRFREANGSTLCPDLKGLNGPVLRSCDGCIEDGVRITLDILEARK